MFPGDEEVRPEMDDDHVVPSGHVSDLVAPNKRADLHFTDL
jgi:hypothetical protein